MTITGQSVGIMQGRLSPKAPERLQSFPVDEWREEFERAAAIGFDTIEWLIDVLDERSNPLLRDAGRGDIRSRIEASGVGVASICAHAFIDGIINRDTSAAAEWFLRVVEAASEMGIDRIVLPLQEAASIATSDSRSAFYGFHEAMSPALHRAKVVLALETDLPAPDLLALIRSLQDPAVCVCYDVGNAVSRGEDPIAGLRMLGPVIGELHVKDRLAGGASVMLGDGDVRFDAVFASMGPELEGCPMILETPVGVSWQDSAMHNFKFVSKRMAGAGRATANR